MALNTTRAVSPQAINRLERVWQEAVQQGLPVGGEILLSQHGKRLFHAASGWMDREQLRPMTKGVSFRLASLTKLLTSVVAMKFIEKGKLSLDTPVNSVLPFFKPALANGIIPSVTIRHLLTHTSGLSYGFEQPAGNIYERSGISDGLDLPAHDLEENLHKLGAVPLLFEPGSRWQYSLATDVLGWVISQIENDTFANIVKREVTDPLQMHNTAFHISDESLLATPYLQSGRRMTDNEILPVGEGVARLSPKRATTSNAWYSAGAGLIGTAEDYHRLLECLRQGGAPILSADSTARLLANATGEMAIGERNAGWGHGLGCMVLVDPERAQRREGAGSWSWFGLYGSYYWVDPRAGLSLVMLTNTAGEKIWRMLAEKIQTTLCS
ncbi:serine hydrolase domain-containing protein [Klebsiella aerogenes]|uniref:serine hydrolase domain-containing protein n=1 Tax=Klebsiella aerogenes TaxID=548 RepID=UPI002D7E2BD8|nr:serine hydrolase domain-containing protein [Klebsiella aerogenes]